MRHLIKYTAVFLALLIFTFCENNLERGNEKQKQDSVKKNVITDSIARRSAEPLYDKQEGMLGVFNVPEMLCLSKMDSAPSQHVADKVARDYGLLEKETARIGAKIDGPPGRISYNNDPKNFKFECLLLISEFPKKEPKNCKVVVLESSEMLIYNYYGPYQDLHTAYEKIRKYCYENKFKQIGPMREFFVSDPAVENDASKLLTRIMLPVKKV